MRLAAALLLLAIATPAVAADTVADQAHNAYQLFTAGQSELDFLSAQYGRAVFSNVAGTWVHLGGPDPKSGAETYGPQTEKLCASPAAITVASPNALTLTVTTNLPQNNFTQQYSLIAGSTFAEHTDLDAYLKAVGVGFDKTGTKADQQRAVAISVANGLVQIYHPSPDILVLTRENGYPIVFARCPAK
jgi:hypothetical protein